MKRSTCALFATLAVTFGLVHSDAKAESIKLTFATPHGGSIAAIEAFQKYFGPEVTKRTDGQVTFEYLVGGSLAKGGDELEAVQTGLADMGGIVLPYYCGKMPLVCFGYWLPFGPSDPATVINATGQLAKDVPALPNSIEQYNQKVLYWASFSDYNMISTFPIESVEDMKGEKVSVVGINAPWFEAIDMVPVTTYVAEDYVALETGVFSAETLTWPLIHILKLYEPAPYATEVNLGAPLGYAFTINKDTWNELPSDVQEVILDVAAEAEQKTVEHLKSKTQDAIAAMKEAGTQFSTLPDAEIQRWVEALDNIPAMRAKEAEAEGLPGTRLIRRYIQLTRELGYSYPREWNLD